MKKGQSDSKIMILRPSAPFSEDLHPHQMQTSKSPKLLGLCLGSSGVEFLVLRGKLGAELFNTAGFNDTGLSTGVERMAFRRGIELVERIGLAVDFDGLFRLNRARNDEGLVDREVNEGNLTVLGVNIGFHLIKIPIN